MHIKNIIFDFHDVIMDTNQFLTIQELGRLMGASAMEVATSEAFHQLHHQFEIGAVDSAGFVRAMQKFSPRPVAEEDVIRGWNMMLLDIPPERLTLLRELKRDYDLYLLSNSNPLHHRHAQDHLLTKHGISDFERDFFEGAYYSHLIQKKKPDVEFYRQLLSEHGLVPGETLFIDDIAENVEVARSLGIHAIHHDPKRDITQTLQEWLERPGLDSTGR